MTYRVALRRALRTFFQTFSGTLPTAMAIDALSKKVVLEWGVRVGIAAMGAFNAALIAFSMNLGGETNE